MRQEGHLVAAATSLLPLFALALSTLAALLLLSLAKERNSSLETLSEAEEILLKEEQFLERVFSAISSKRDSSPRRREEEDREWLELKNFLGTFAEAPSLQSPRGNWPYIVCIVKVPFQFSDYETKNQLLKFIFCHRRVNPNSETGWVLEGRSTFTLASQNLHLQVLFFSDQLYSGFTGCVI